MSDKYLHHQSAWQMEAGGLQTVMPLHLLIIAVMVNGLQVHALTYR